MIDMQRKPEPKPQKGTMLAGYEDGHDEEPRYPWGLEIRLESDELEKLGLSPENLPTIGQTIPLSAIARVTAIRLERMQGEDSGACLTLQIEQLELNTGPGPSLAERMYGSK